MSYKEMGKVTFSHSIQQLVLYVGNCIFGLIIFCDFWA